MHEHMKEHYAVGPKTLGCVPVVPNNAHGIKTRLSKMCIQLALHKSTKLGSIY